VDPKYGCTSTRAGMRWSYGDWGFFPDVGRDSFNENNEALSSNFDRMLDDEEYDGDSEILWTAILKGFKRVDADDFFGTGSARSKITLLLAGDLPEDLVNAWISALNPPNVVDQFMNWDVDALD
jgi:hypothetical protein